MLWYIFRFFNILFWNMQNAQKCFRRAILAWKLTISPGKVGFYKKSETSAGDVSEKFGFRTKATYPEKLLVWITLSEKGISETFLSLVKASLTGSVYREDFLKQHLVPFLEEHHADGDYFVWPDFASCHYVNETQDLFNKLEIQFFTQWIKLP